MLCKAKSTAQTLTFHFTQLQQNLQNSTAVRKKREVGLDQNHGIGKLRRSEPLLTLN
jgi:hypothetical protein